MSMSEAAKQAWRTKWAKKAARTRKQREKHRELSKRSKREVGARRKVQLLVAGCLKRWWKRKYLEGTSSRPKPPKCIVCGETERLGLATHHIDPKIKKGDKRYNTFENRAPLCGTCHNIITYKKSKKPEDILKAIKSRHSIALERKLFED